MTIFIVAAVDSAYNIGNKANKEGYFLPWQKDQEELAYYKQLITKIQSKSTIFLCGVNTYKTLPPAAKRRSFFVFTDDMNIDIQLEPSAQLQSIQKIQDKEFYFDPDINYVVIGGGMFYKLMLPLADTVCLSMFRKDFSSSNPLDMVTAPCFKLCEEAMMFKKHKIGATISMDNNCLIEFFAYNRIKKAAEFDFKGADCGL